MKKTTGKWRKCLTHKHHIRNKWIKLKMKLNCILMFRRIFPIGVKFKHWAINSCVVESLCLKFGQRANCDCWKWNITNIHRFVAEAQNDRIFAALQPHGVDWVNAHECADHKGDHPPNAKKNKSLFTLSMCTMHITLYTVQSSVFCGRQSRKHNELCSWHKIPIKCQRS